MVLKPWLQQQAPSVTFTLEDHRWVFRPTLLILDKPMTWKHGLYIRIDRSLGVTPGNSNSSGPGLFLFFFFFSLRVWVFGTLSRWPGGPLTLWSLRCFLSQSWEFFKSEAGWKRELEFTEFLLCRTFFTYFYLLYSLTLSCEVYHPLPILTQDSRRFMELLKVRQLLEGSASICIEVTCFPLLEHAVG